MSLKHMPLILGISCVGLVIGFASMALKKQYLPQRSVASEKNWRPTSLGKHLAPVLVQIITPPALPDYDNQEIELTGYITINQQVDGDLQYQWKLPEGVTLVDGYLSDGWADVPVGETAVTKISVLGFSKASKRVISLEGFVQVDGNVMGNTATLSSRPEDSMESVAPQMMDIKNHEEPVPSGKSRRQQ